MFRHVPRSSAYCVSPVGEPEVWVCHDDLFYVYGVSDWHLILLQAWVSRQDLRYMGAVVSSAAALKRHQRVRLRVCCHTVAECVCLYKRVCARAHARVCVCVFDCARVAFRVCQCVCKHFTPACLSDGALHVRRMFLLDAYASVRTGCARVCAHARVCVCVCAMQEYDVGD